MENTNLTTEEKKELKKNGFLVKNYFDLLWLFREIWLSAERFSLHIFLSLAIWITFTEWAITTSSIFLKISVIIFLIYPIYLYIKTLFIYLILGRVFFYKANYFWWLIPSSYLKYFIENTKFFRNEEKKDNKRKAWTIYDHRILGAWFWIIISNIISFKIAIYDNRIFDIMISWILPLLLLLGFMLIFSIIIHYLLPYFHPLYAFGNLWEKIQKLTPQIETQSKTIEKNFTSDMSYQVLSDGFDGLASSFAQIVSLVIRLEWVEARANRGNLFDSERYISSLRSDIVWPLLSLRGFLDSKRTELISSREELSRVQVPIGGASENIVLTSARTESLMRELTENINQLDMMIEKMG